MTTETDKDRRGLLLRVDPLWLSNERWEALMRQVAARERRAVVRWEMPGWKKKRRRRSTVEGA